MRESDVEADVMQGGVEESEEEYKPPVCLPAYGKTLSCSVGYGQDDKSRDTEADACKQYLASGEVGGYSELFKSQFDEWVGPSPYRGSCECEDGYPQRSLEDACALLVHDRACGIRWLHLSHADGYNRGACRH